MSRNEIGAWVSIAYAVCLCALTEGRWEQLNTMDLNELGDFLAGAFSPLAFLWLVLGFFQQGDELRLQARELHAAVEQHRVIAKVALDEQEVLRRQREEEELASTPRFVFRVTEAARYPGSQMGWRVEMGNVGGECTGVQLTVVGTALSVEPDHIHRLDKSGPQSLYFIGDRADLTEPQTLQINYFDLRGRPWSGEWTVSLSSESDDGLSISFDPPQENA